MRHPIGWYALALALAACRGPMLAPAPTSPEGLAPDLAGQVLFPARRAQATMQDVATAATVSLIHAGAHRTEATTVTDEQGRFRLSFGSGFVPDPTATYYLEAVKGLDGHAPGRPAVRVRTLARYSSGWLSLTNSTVGGALNLSSGTTAVSLGAALRQGTADEIALAGLMGHVAGEAFAPVAHLDATDFQTLKQLVQGALTDGMDPVACIGLSLPSTWLRLSPGGASMTVAGIAPTSGSVGSTVTFSGAGFQLPADRQLVRFNGTPATASAATYGLLTTEVPAGATSGQTTVQLDQLIAMGPLFAVDLTLTGMSPASGSAGTSVVLRGTGFDASHLAGNLVRFGDVPATVTAATPTQLTVTVPAGATSAPLQLTVSGATLTSSGSFTVPVTLTGISPERSSAGNPLVLSGLGFSPVPAENEVTLGGVAATVTAATPTQLTVTIPPTSSGPVRVAVKGQAGVAALSFTCSQALLAAVQPPLAGAGETLMLEGNFGSEVSVTFPGGTLQSASVLGPNRASVTVPAGAGTGELAVLNCGQTTRWPFHAAAGTLTLQQGRRQLRSAVMPTSLRAAYDGHGAALVGPYVYVVGGRESGYARCDVQRARLAADGTLGAFGYVPGLVLKAPREHANCLVIGNYLYVLGGTSQGVARDSVERALILADGNLGAFALVDTTLVTARYGAAAAVVGDRLYLVGGHSDATALDTLEAAPILPDGALGPFAVVGALGAARSQAAVLVARTTMSVVGGLAAGGSALATSERAAIAPDGTLGAFQPGPALPTPRASAQLLAAGGTCYLVGGDTPAGVAASIEHAAIQPDGTLGAFQTSTRTLATGRTRAASLLVGQGLVVLGGATATGGTATVERLELVAGGSLGTVAPTLDTQLTAPREGYAHAVIGRWLYLLGGTNPGLLASVERAPILPDGKLGAFAAVPGLNLVQARAYASCVVVGSYLYVLGGSNSLQGGASFYGVPERAEILADGSLGPFAAIPASTLIVPRALTSVVATGAYVRVLGGWGAAGALRSVERAAILPDHTLGPWTEEAAEALNVVREGPWAHATDRYLYVGGGIGNGWLDSVERSPILSDGRLGGFVPLGFPTQHSRYGQTACLIGRWFYLLGGFGAAGTAPATERGALDEADVLAPLADAPDGLLDAPSLNAPPILLGSHVYILGGRQGGTISSTALRADIQ